MDGDIRSPHMLLARSQASIASSGSFVHSTTTLGLHIVIDSSRFRILRLDLRATHETLIATAGHSNI